MASIVLMPQLSDTMRQGKLVKWRKEEGAPVKEGDVLAEIETDKATMDLECFQTGVLLRRLLAEGDIVPVGAGIAIVGKEGEDVSALVEEARRKADELRAKASGAKKEAGRVKVSGKAPARTASAPEAKRPAARPAPARAAVLAEAGTASNGLRASPLARKIARAHGLPLERVEGSGPGGRIVAADVEAAVARGLHLAAAGAPAAPRPVRLANRLEDRVIPFDGRRKTIARRLQEAKREVPHYYLQETVRADALVAARQARAAEGMKVSYNDLVMFAVARALVGHPAVNVTVEGDSIRRHAHVHLGFAVSLGGGETSQAARPRTPGPPDDGGLITPVIREAETLSLEELAEAIRDLSDRARAGGLDPDEYEGATFTVSNLGMYGIENFAAVVNPPAAAILAVAGVRRAAVATPDGAVKAGWTLGLTLSCDHRAIDGAVGAAFLQDLRRVLESADR